MADSEEKRKKAAQDMAPNWRKSKSEVEETNKKQEREERLEEARKKATRDKVAKAQPEARQKAAAGEGPAAEGKEAVAPQPQYMAEHTVAGGETLSQIALKYYNSAVRDKWMAIYEANKDIIGDNPSLVRPGQVLKIPKL